MNFRNLFNLAKRPTDPPQQLLDGQRLTETPFDFDIKDFGPDQLGQGVGRLVYSVNEMHRIKPEKYDTALGIFETFKKLRNYENKMKFWKTNPNVFGYAGIVVFDTYQKEYWPYYGRPYAALYSDLSEPENRYKMASIFPDGIDQFRLFWEWCLNNYWRTVNRKKAISEGVHWEEIKTVLSPSDYINGCLASTLAKLEVNNNLPAVGSSGIYSLYTDEQAKKYFFFFGNKEATWGTVDDMFDVTDLYAVLRGIITCPLSTYAEIISYYKYGYDETVRLVFLKKQQGRLHKGEGEESVRLPLIPYQDIVVDQLHNLLKSTKSYDSLQYLSQFPWFQDIKPNAPDYQLVYKLINEYRLAGSILGYQGKIMNAFFTAWENFYNEYQGQLRIMNGDKLSRTTYIRNIMSRLYMSTDEYLYLDKLYNLLSPDTLEECGVPLNNYLKNELDQIRLVLFHCNDYAFTVSAVLERDLQVEGITIKNGWIMCKQVEPREEAAEQSQIAIDIDDIVKETALKNPITLTDQFTNLFNTDSEAYSCIALMQRMNLVDSEGKHRIGERDKSQLMAFVEALQQKSLLPSTKTTADLTSIVAKQIHLDYSRPRNGDRKKYDDSLGIFISKLNSISTLPLFWTIVDDSGR